MDVQTQDCYNDYNILSSMTENFGEKYKKDPTYIHKILAKTDTLMKNCSYVTSVYTNSKYWNDVAKAFNN